MEHLTGTVTVERPGRTLPIAERWLSAVMGILSAMYGLKQRDAAGLGLLVAGGYLLYRSVTGNCPIYEWLGVYSRSDDVAPVEETPPASIERGDKVTESSWESFPTSDPPSWTLDRE